MVHASCSFAEKLMSNHFTLYIFFFLVSINCVQNLTLPQHTVKQPRELERPSSPITLDFPGILWIIYMYIYIPLQIKPNCMRNLSNLLNDFIVYSLRFTSALPSSNFPWCTKHRLFKRPMVLWTKLEATSSEEKTRNYTDTADQYSFRMTKLRPNVAEQ